jgi:hypothetical protein
MQSHVRMHAKPKALSPASFTGASEVTARAKEVLFEVVGYPHFIEGEDTCEGFFAAAKKFPPKNAAM